MDAEDTLPRVIERGTDVVALLPIEDDVSVMDGDITLQRNRPILFYERGDILSA